MISFVSRLLLYFIVFPIALLFLIFVSDGYFPGLQYKISKTITQKNISKLKLDLSEKEVIKILGKPFSIKKISSNRNIYEYSTAYFAGIYVQLYFSHRNLIALTIEDSNDNTIYSCTKKLCPYINRCMYDKLIPIE